MNWLPNVAGALVGDTKVRDYLLNPDNVQNSGKAALFTQFGFARDNWQLLAAAICQHPVDNAVFHTTVTTYGTKYVIKCNLVSPDRRNHVSPRCG